MNPSLRFRHLPHRQRQVLRATALVVSYCDPDLFVQSARVAREALRIAPPGQEEEW